MSTFAFDFRTRGVAQLVSAPRSGRGGRKFESSHPDYQRLKWLAFNRLSLIFQQQPGQIRDKIAKKHPRQRLPVKVWRWLFTPDSPGKPPNSQEKHYLCRKKAACICFSSVFSTTTRNIYDYSWWTDRRIWRHHPIQGHFLSDKRERRVKPKLRCIC